MTSTIQHGELQIKTDKQGDRVQVSFSGDCDFKRPEEILTPFFDDLIVQNYREILVSFTQLTFMNSSMIPPIIQLINQLETRKIKAVITYDGDLKWQVKSFRFLQAFVQSNKLTSVIVRPN